MFAKSKSSTAIITALVLAIASGPSLAKGIQVAPTGDGAGEAECKRYEDAINSWGNAEVEALEKLNEKGARKAQRNTQRLIDKATDAGCFVIY